MTLPAAIIAIATALQGDMRAAFGWGADVKIYLNGTTVPPSSDTYGEVEFSLPTIEGMTRCNDQARVPFDLSARWPASAVPGDKLRGVFQIEQASALRDRLLASTSYAGVAGLLMVTAILLDDADVEKEGGVAITVSFECSIQLPRGPQGG